MKLPSTQFLHQMGAASIIAGIVLIGLAEVSRHTKKLR